MGKKLYLVRHGETRFNVEHRVQGGGATRLLPPEECVSYYLPFGGDSSDWVRDRMVETLTQVMSQEGHERVLAVSHLP